jgi:hypothetical protein
LFVVVVCTRTVFVAIREIVEVCGKKDFEKICRRSKFAYREILKVEINENHLPFGSGGKT